MYCQCIVQNLERKNLPSHRSKQEVDTSSFPYCTLHSALWTLHLNLALFTVHSEQWTVHVEERTVQCEQFCVQCAMYAVKCAVCSLKCALCSVQFAVCSVQCAVCSVQCVVCSIVESPGQLLTGHFQTYFAKTFSLEERGRGYWIRADTH